MNSRATALNKAKEIRQRLRQQRKKVVFTNGCFDVLHAGHVTYLEKARGLGDFLIVGLNSDTSVRKLKGPGRPVISLRERTQILLALRSVDMVVGFSEDTPLNLIKALQPDILTKGADYKIGEIVGGREVIGWGGAVRRIPLVKGKSTSTLLKKIRSL